MANLLYWINHTSDHIFRPQTDIRDLNCYSATKSSNFVGRDILQVSFDEDLAANLENLRLYYKLSNPSNKTRRVLVS